MGKNAEMDRVRRVGVGGMIYHAPNRANFRSQLFRKAAHYEDFPAAVGESWHFGRPRKGMTPFSFLSREWCVATAGTIQDGRFKIQDGSERTIQDSRFKIQDESDRTIQDGRFRIQDESDRTIQDGRFRIQDESDRTIQDGRFRIQDESDRTIQDGRFRIQDGSGSQNGAGTFSIKRRSEETGKKGKRWQERRVQSAIEGKEIRSRV